MMGKLFGHRSSKIWHKKIDEISQEVNPTDQSIFPWAPLQTLTDDYVKNKKNLTPYDLDQRLLGLVRDHGRKEVAIAACTHVLSPQSLKILLGELDPGVESQSNLGFYLQSIVAASYVNSGVVSQTDAVWAQELLYLSTLVHSQESLAQHLPIVVGRLLSHPCHTSLLHDHVVAHARKVCSAFASHLEALRASNQSIQPACADTVKWLAGIPARLEDGIEPLFGPRELLDGCFPHWRIWARWRPSIERLQRWRQIPISRRAPFVSFMALEGPDFSGQGKETLRDGLIQRSDNSPQDPDIWWEKIRIEVEPDRKNEARRMIERLMRVIEMSSRSDADYAALFSHLCIDKPITTTNLTLLQDTFYAPNTLTSAILQSQTIRGENLELGIGNIKKMIPDLQDLHYESLQETLGPYLVYQISNYLGRLQDNLCTELDATSVVGETMLDLISYRRAVRHVSWLLPMLDTRLRNAISTVPTLETIRALMTLHSDVRTASSLDHSQRKLGNEVQDHCKTLIILGWNDDALSESIIPTMVDLWQQHLNREQQELAIKIASREEFGLEIQRQFLSQLRMLSRPILMKTLAALETHGKDQFDACVEFIGILSRDPGSDVTLCWRQALYPFLVIFDQPFVAYAIADGVAKWLDLLANINLVYCDEMNSSSPTLLQPALQEWTSLLQEQGYMEELESFEISLGRGPALQCLLTGSGSKESLLQLLGYLKDSMCKHWQKVVEAIVSMLRYDGSNAGALVKILSFSCRMTVSGTQYFMCTLKWSQEGSSSLAVTLAAATLQAFPSKSPERFATRQLLHYLGLQFDLAGAPRVKDLETSAKYLEDRRMELMREAQRLECLRLSLSKIEPDMTFGLLKKLNIEIPSVADDALATMPSALIDVVKKLGDNQVELQFLVDRSTKLQNRALGAHAAQSLFVRLIIPSKDLLAGFCVHVHESRNALAINDHQHSPWMITSSGTGPNLPYCRGVTKRGEYQLSRILYRSLRKRFEPLGKTYAFIASCIDHLGEHCIVCGCKHGACLIRPAICSSPKCATTFSRVSSRIVLEDIWHDPPVVKLLLTALYATTSTGNDSILLGSPFSDAPSALKLLESLPYVENIQKALEVHMGETPAESVSAENPQAQSAGLPGLIWSFSELLFPKSWIGGTGVSSLVDAGSSHFQTTIQPTLVWACTKYSGFLTTASGQLRIPTFPSDNQYLLANSSAALEKAFADEYRKAQFKSTVLFHGTSLDRLYPILSEGLRICSGTSLQYNGAVHGVGIYMGEEPKTSWDYSRDAPSISGLKWSDLKATRVLLGCEFAGVSVARRPGIHVISDPRRLIVRYVFLMPPDAKMPAANHVVPAMQSVFANLRSRTI
ncbi:hypothetical protein BDR22DRAFT_717550 [Usnea florida]